MLYLRAFVVADSGPLMSVCAAAYDRVIAYDEVVAALS